MNFSHWFSPCCLALLVSGCGGGGSATVTGQPGNTATVGGVTFEISSADGQTIRTIERKSPEGVVEGYEVVCGGVSVKIVDGQISVSTDPNKAEDSYVGYGSVSDGDSVEVKDGVVSVNGEARQNTGS